MRKAFLALSFLLAAASAFGVEVTAGRVLQLGLELEFTPERTRDYRLEKVIPVSQTRALALIAEQHTEPVGPTPTPSAFRKPLWEGPPPFRLSNRVMLAFLNREGQVVSWTKVDSEGGGEKGRWEDAHLLAIEADACPYAVIPPDRHELFCFDWQLNALKSYELPPAVYTGVASVFTTEGLEVWLFPMPGSAPRGERTTASYKASLFEPVEKLELVAFRLKIPSGEVQPLAVDAGKLVHRLQLFANKGRKDPLTVQPGSVRLLPVREKPGVPPVRLVITAVAAASYENELHFTGERLFFLAELFENSTGKLEMLPFRFRHEEGVAADFDEKNGVVVLPAFVEPWQLKAFEAGKDGVAVYCKVMILDEEKLQAVREGKPQQVAASSFFLVAQKRQAHFVDFDSVEAATEKLSTSRLKVSPVTVLLGRVGPQEFVFRAGCLEPPSTVWRCATTVELTF
ncbi:MAG: hypothetical protein ACOY7U_03145 [Acidobacteriota bacterium]|jgi:hypothetical protein|nr:MAG: hypothetical protein KatS3mg007_1962 [Thermoanaerobaculum sp.]